MKIEIKATGDGSKTIYLPQLDETYHSHHGAVQEALHVFIKHGVQFIEKEDLRIFELGFGTGLNAILAACEATMHERKIEYTGVEAFPVPLEVALEMNYEQQIGAEWQGLFEQLHTCEWDEVHVISPNFTFRKVNQKVEDFPVEPNYYDLIFFDAFGPRAQNELWQRPILSKMFELLAPGGVFVTYCAMGQFKRDLKSLGFLVESLPGPPGKREMTRAVKR